MPLRGIATSSARARVQSRKNLVGRDRARRPGLQLLVAPSGFLDPQALIFIGRQLIEAVEQSLRKRGS